MIYNLDIFDPASGRDRHEIRIVQIGEIARHDLGYGKFREDSALWIIHEPSIREKDYDLLSATYGNIPGPAVIVPYLYENGKWRETQQLFGPIQIGGYNAFDSVAHQEWELLDDSRTILGLECKAARTNFRGRDWIAWYAPELAYPAGPWKLGGLPGLILLAEDASGEYKMEARQLRHGSGPILRKYDKFAVLSREKLHNLVRQANEYPFRNPIYNPNGGENPRANERSFYNPIEKSLN